MEVHVILKCLFSLQAAEDYLVHLFEDAMLCAIHAKRVTVSKCSFVLNPSLISLFLWYALQFVCGILSLYWFPLLAALAFLISLVQNNGYTLIYNLMCIYSDSLAYPSLFQFDFGRFILQETVILMPSVGLFVTNAFIFNKVLLCADGCAGLLEDSLHS